MPLKSEGESVLRFPDWEIRPRERALVVRGERARIGSRAFDVLRALAERPGQVVGKSALLDLAWPGLVVEENNLSVQVTTLRRLLGADTIVTVSGVGYMLAAAPAVATVEAEAPLPPPQAGTTALFGRDAELQLLRRRMDEARLVSIVGAGGVGKTTLARAAVEQSAATWSDGVHWIDLAPLQHGSPVMPLLAKALGISLTGADLGPPAFAAALAPLHALVALDNCEHVLDEVASVVGPALAVAPGLHWVATSQEPLRLPHEVVFRLEPLDVPSPALALSSAIETGALALFVARVRAADQRFELSETNLAPAVEICSRLDGLPLALEMAAARVASLGLDGVRDQLGERLRLRTGVRDAPVRHHTLLQTYEWSYGLLSPAERTVFRRLEPFLGGFPATMVPRVCVAADDAEPLDGWQAAESLAALVDKSLVRRLGGTPERFQLLESGRDFARLRLIERDEWPAVRRRHAEVVAEWFAPALADWERLRDADWSARYVPERHNARAALAWACEARDALVLARLVAAIALLDRQTQSPAEVVRRDVPLDVLGAAPAPERARACLELGYAHYQDGDREVGARLVEQALSDFEMLGDATGIHLSLSRLVRLCEGRPGSQERARELVERLRHLDDLALPLRTRLACTIEAGLQYGGRTIARLQELHDIAERSGFDSLAAVCRTHISDELLIEGRFEDAVSTIRSMLARGEQRPRTHALQQHNLALALVRLGRFDEARVAARVVLRALPSASHMVVDLFAFAAAADGRHVDAALMLGHSDRVKQQRSLRSDPAEAALRADSRRQLGLVLAPGRLEELMATGAKMAMDDVLALALRA